MNTTAKTFEQQIAALVRMLGATHDGEKIAAVNALQRKLASQGASCTDLGNAIEKLATGGLEEAEMKRVFDVGHAQGLEEAQRKVVEARPSSASIRTAQPIGKRSRSTVSATRRGSSPRAMSSSTTWPRACLGGASRLGGRGRICSASFASLVGECSDYRGRRSRGAAVH
jgi:hypothetical protein